MIYLIRHGQSTSNALGLLVGRSDPELTAMGRAQAQALQPWTTNVREVWSSPLRRARETAALAVPHVDATIVEAFIEVDYGTLEGLPLDQLTSEDWRRFESDHTRPLGDGESLEAVDRRVHWVLNQLLSDHESYLHQPDDHLAIVSHVSPIKSAATWAMGVPGSAAWRMRIDNGSLTAVHTRQASPTLVRSNAVPH